MTAPTSARSVGLVGWLTLLLLCASAALAALLESLFVPLYAGGTLVPVTVLATIVTNVALPLLARAVVPTMGGTVAPFVVWLVVVIGFGVLTRPEGDVILPGGDPQWVSYAVLLGGALVGTITVISSVPRAPEMTRRQQHYRRPPSR
ncbi:hypothetical protein [uncultured Jatrophihabitans sp.]|uniref:hypothetical protein n=1 Tax=uncultured Jatrophihabitans sp. TaxID=1610747 RepID=UPI0035CB4461